MFMGSCNRQMTDEMVESSYGSVLLECCESPNSLSSTLRLLNITNTGVTSQGVFLALQYATYLQSVGDYPHINRVLQLANTKYQIPPKFHLKNARISVTSAHTIDLVSRLCPNIEQLTALDTKFLPRELSPKTIPSSLKSIILLGIPPHPKWLTEFYTFLNGIIGNQICELVLKFFCKELLVNLEIDKLLQMCPMLKILVIDGADVTWENSFPNSKRISLEKVQIGQIVTRQVITNIITSSPNLITAHFYACPALIENDLVSLNSISLKCFYVYETRLKNTCSIVINLLNNCPNIKHIGNIRDWGGSVVSTCDILQLAKDKNYDLQFNAGSHWFCSTCINKYE